MVSQMIRSPLLAYALIALTTTLSANEIIAKEKYVEESPKEVCAPPEKVEETVPVKCVQDPCQAEKVEETVPVKCVQDPCQVQGAPLVGFCPAYNAPAAIDVNHKNWKCCVSNVNSFIDLSFTYWYAGEEGLSIATTGVLSSGTSYFAQNTATLLQTFDYKPGFKVGLGIVGENEWVLHAEYTYFRGTNNTSSGAPLSATVNTAGAAAPLTGTSSWLVDDWFLQGTTAGQALSGSSVSSSWHLAMDLVDVMFSRPFYQGRKIIASPYGGLRAAFIRQNMTVNLTESSGIVSGALPPQPISSNNSSHSWAIGPKAGCEGQCLLPMGFRFNGDFGASLLYTRYTTLNHSETAASKSFNAGPYTASITNYGALRPAVELGLGIGWGKYLCNKEYHMDFSADYDFMYFWAQNMMRYLIDRTLTGTSPSSTDLFLHGLTITGRFDF